MAPKGTSSEKKSTDTCFPEKLGMVSFAPLAFSPFKLLLVTQPCSLQTLDLHAYPMLSTGICERALRNRKSAIRKGHVHSSARNLEAVI